MNSTSLERLVNTVLYEGYILYPYRPSATKNRRERFTFGRVYPRAYSDAQRGAERYVIQTECLVHSLADNFVLKVTMRFLQPIWREVGVVSPPAAESANELEPPYQPVSELVVGGKLYQSWHEALEREVTLFSVSIPVAGSCATACDFSFPASQAFEALSEKAGGPSLGVLVRRQETIKGVLKVKAEAMGPHCAKVTVCVLNVTPMPESELTNQDKIILRTFASTHILLRAEGGEFVSLTDPPEAQRESAKRCQNIGVWPVLVGDEAKQERSTMLCSPIILYDYPKVAPETDGDFCDATEIDEMLALRVMTLSDGEKGEMRSADAFARKILERTEALLPHHLQNLHGAMRPVNQPAEFFNPAHPLTSATVGGVIVQAGDKVRLRPRKGADAFDLMLAGRTATIEAIEQDAEDKVHLAVVVDDDPGKDLGFLRQPGHRFFYGLDEVEPVQGGSP